MSEKRPLIGVIADFRVEDPHAYHCAGDKYIRAVVDGTRGIPFVIPALGADLSIEQVLAPLDGLLLTGGYSNIEPWRYGSENIEADPLRDAARDETACRLVDFAISRKLPVLGICRGCQEINVALGGSLHQKVQEVPKMLDHREDKTQNLAQQYGPAHDIAISPGGYL
ncbi:MAG: gamma-glutamyl-gamma-aminobutyrate hydrolase family protein, partial [Pseudomonadales bacterium]